MHVLVERAALSATVSSQVYKRTANLVNCFLCICSQLVNPESASQWQCADSGWTFTKTYRVVEVIFVHYKTRLLPPPAFRNPALSTLLQFQASISGLHFAFIHRANRIFLTADHSSSSRTQATPTFLFKKAVLVTVFRAELQEPSFSKFLFTPLRYTILCARCKAPSSSCRIAPSSLRRIAPSSSLKPPVRSSTPLPISSEPYYTLGSGPRCRNARCPSAPYFIHDPSFHYSIHEQVL